MAKIYIFLAALAVFGTLLGTAYLTGRSHGAQNEAVRRMEATRDLNERLRRAEVKAQVAEAERLAEIDKLDETISELRKQANADPNADRIAIGADSVRRLNSVR